MKENTGFTERRQHTRTSVKNIIIAVINSDQPEMIGYITDISLGGVRFTYQETRKTSPKQPIHSIDIITDNNCLFNIPCDCAWHGGVKTEADSKLTNVNLYGIQFGKLTSSQLSSLTSIIAASALSYLI